MQITVSTSKILLFFVMLTYFIGLFAGLYFVWHTINTAPEYTVQVLVAMFGYIGAPTGVTIAFYSWKAKNENMSKYNYPTEGE